MKRSITLKIKDFIRHELGATAVEFAIMANVFFLLSMGIMEFGIINYMKVATQSVALNTARYASIGNTSPGCDIACMVKNYVQQSTKGFIYNSAGKYVNVVATVINDQGDHPAPVPDVCLLTPSDPYPSSCPNGKYINNDGVDGYQSADTTMSLGNPGDLVEIRITYVWRTIFPYMNVFFGGSNTNSGVFGDTRGEVTISSTAVFRNEPAP